MYQSLWKASKTTIVVSELNAACNKLKSKQKNRKKQYLRFAVISKKIQPGVRQQSCLRASRSFLNDKDDKEQEKMYKMSINK